MKIKNGFAMRNIAGSNIVVPVGNMSKEFNGMITLNESGGFLWNCFLKDISSEDAVKMLLSEYDVEEERAKTDVDKFISLLKENDLIEK